MAERDLLPLGHYFAPPLDYVHAKAKCINCGQPRSAHEPKRAEPEPPNPIELGRLGLSGYIRVGAAAQPSVPAWRQCDDFRDGVEGRGAIPPAPGPAPEPAKRDRPDYECSQHPLAQPQRDAAPSAADPEDRLGELAGELYHMTVRYEIDEALVKIRAALEAVVRECAARICELDCASNYSDEAKCSEVVILRHWGLKE